MFDTAALQSSLTELQLESEFPERSSAANSRVVYQPVVAIASGRIVGFEALLRWHHPVLGVIAPLDFVPLAERSGFIVPLGRWTLRQACTQLAAWQGELPWAAQAWMAVNLSTAQLGHATLVDDVTATLRESGLQPDRLVLEVTESLAMADPTGARSVLMELRTHGVRVSIDDFGTGHSSLASLGQLPLDALKMDRSFVRGIEVRPDQGEIVAAVLGMARQLGLRVIAEGIETEAQLAAVRSLGCEYAQGYLFARPMAAAQIVFQMPDGRAIGWKADPTARHRRVPLRLRRSRRPVVVPTCRPCVSWQQPPACCWRCWPGSVPWSAERPTSPSPPRRSAPECPHRTRRSPHRGRCYDDRGTRARRTGSHGHSRRHQRAEGRRQGTVRGAAGQAARRQADDDARAASARDGQLPRAPGGVASRGRVRARRPRTTRRGCVHVPSR